MKQNIIALATLGLLSVSASAFDTKGCIGCHGANFEKAAMGKSKIVKDMSKEDIEKALKGYKDGSYGGAMKAMMKGQATRMSDEDIASFAGSFSSEGNATKSDDNTTKSDDNATKSDDNVTEATPAKEVNVAGCTGCHGQNFEKAAMGKSKKVNEMSKADIEKALKGYKDGSYGGAMKGVMKGQAMKMSEDDIKAFAEKFGK